MEIILIRIAQLILALSLLIVVHELGHYLMARLFKVRVEKFYLFFNPSFSIFRMKKINGKWRFKFFAKNDSNTKKRIAPNGNVVEDTIPLELLPDDNWQKYPESTEWGIGWLPLGGYVKIAGMIDESMDTSQMQKPAQSWEFRSKKAWQRLLIMIAGVAVNFFAALVIYSAILFTWGNTYVEMKNIPMEFSRAALNAGFEHGDHILAADGNDLGRFNESSLIALLEARNVTVLRENEKMELQMPEEGLIRSVLRERTWLVRPFMPAIVDSILPNSPAERYLKHGDRFVMIGDSVEVVSFGVLQDFLSANTERTITVSVLRNGEILTQKITLNQAGKFGFFPKRTLQLTPNTEYFTFLESIPAGVAMGIQTLRNYIAQFRHVFTREGATSLGGFGTIGGLFPAQWDWHAFWMMTALLSIILAFMNMLPIPALDGGHVLFLLYEIVTRRKPSVKFLTYAQVIGMLLLLSLFFYANALDLIRAFF